MKKMRRLIPAIAMLLVSAVMLSTASFAWFTMNDKVTASGMQIQAQATGSFVISKAPLNYKSGDTSVDLTSSNQKLKPMTWGEIADDATTADVDETFAGWIVPAATIDPYTGNFAEGEDAKWESAGLSASSSETALKSYYIEQTLYIGSAGDTLYNQILTIDLNALAAPDSEASLAYAIGIYVIEQNDDGKTWNMPGVNAEPDETIYVDKTDGRNTVEIAGDEGKGYTIPTIVGVGAQDDKTTGLLILVRFFVDGDLDAIVMEEGVAVEKTKEVVTGYNYKAVAAGSFDANGAYYVANTYDYTEVENPDQANIGSYFTQDDEGNYVAAAGNIEAGKTYYTRTPATYVPAVITEGMTDFPADVTWYYREVKKEQKAYKLVNAEDVPTSGTSLEITISGDTWVDPNANNGQG